jgi:hypothetical protein
MRHPGTLSAHGTPSFHHAACERARTEPEALWMCLYPHHLLPTCVPSALQSTGGLQLGYQVAAMVVTLAIAIPGEAGPGCEL